MLHFRLNGSTFRIIAAFGLLVLLASVGALPAEARSTNGESRAVPRLYEPGETVDPAAGPSVKFRWGAESMVGDTHQHDDFRLFKGNQAYANAMIHHVQVPPGQGWTEVPSDLVREPGIYCWTVKRVGVRGRTRDAFSVFKVKGKS